MFVQPPNVMVGDDKLQETMDCTQCGEGRRPLPPPSMFGEGKRPWGMYPPPSILDPEPSDAEISIEEVRFAYKSKYQQHLPDMEHLTSSVSAKCEGENSPSSLTIPGLTLLDKTMPHDVRKYYSSLVTPPRVSSFTIPGLSLIQISPTASILLHKDTASVVSPCSSPDVQDAELADQDFEDSDWLTGTGEQDIHGETSNKAGNWRRASDMQDFGDSRGISLKESLEGAINDMDMDSFIKHVATALKEAHTNSAHTTVNCDVINDDIAQCPTSPPSELNSPPNTEAERSESPDWKAILLANDVTPVRVSDLPPVEDTVKRRVSVDLNCNIKNLVFSEDKEIIQSQVCQTKTTGSNIRESLQENVSAKDNFKPCERNCSELLSVTAKERQKFVENLQLGGLFSVKMMLKKNRDLAKCTCTPDNISVITKTALFCPSVPAFTAKSIVLELIRSGADINHRDGMGLSALHRATLGGREDVVKFLLDKGADPMLQTGEGVVSYQLAMQEGHRSLVKLLEPYMPVCDRYAPMYWSKEETPSPPARPGPARQTPPGRPGPARQAPPCQVPSRSDPSPLQPARHASSCPDSGTRAGEKRKRQETPTGSTPSERHVKRPALRGSSMSTGPVKTPVKSSAKRLTLYSPVSSHVKQQNPSHIRVPDLSIVTDAMEVEEEEVILVNPSYTDFTPFQKDPDGGHDSGYTTNEGSSSARSGSTPGTPRSAPDSARQDGIHGNHGDRENALLGMRKDWCPVCDSEYPELRAHAMTSHLPWYMSLTEDVKTSPTITECHQTILSRLLIPTITESRIAARLSCVTRVTGQLLSGMLEYLAGCYKQPDVGSLLVHVLERQLWPSVLPGDQQDMYLVDLYQRHTGDVDDEVEFSPPNHPSALLHWKLLLYLISRLPHPHQEALRSLERFTIPTHAQTEVHDAITRKFFTAVRGGWWSDLGLVLDGWPGVVRGRTEDGSGPVWAALHHQQYLLPVILVLAGADPRQADHKWRTPLVCATRAGDTRAHEMVRELCALAGHLDIGREDQAREGEEESKRVRTEREEISAIVENLLHGPELPADKPNLSRDNLSTGRGKGIQNVESYQPFIADSEDEDDEEKNVEEKILQAQIQTRGRTEGKSGGGTEGKSGGRTEGKSGGKPLRVRGESHASLVDLEHNKRKILLALAQVGPSADVSQEDSLLPGDDVIADEYDVTDTESDTESVNSRSAADDVCPVCRRVPRMHGGDMVYHVTKKHLPWYVGIDYQLTDGDVRKTRLSVKLREYIHTTAVRTRTRPLPCVEMIWAGLLHGLLELIQNELGLESRDALLQYTLRERLWMTSEDDVTVTDQVMADVYKRYLGEEVSDVSALLHPLTLGSLLGRLPPETRRRARTYEAYTWDPRAPSLPSLSGPRPLDLPPAPRPGLQEDFLSAACDGDLAAVSRMLEESPGLVRSTGPPWSSGALTSTLRYSLCPARSLEMALLLILRGAPLDQPDARGWTALHCAVDDNRSDVIKFLVTWGASVTAKDKKGQTPLDLAAAAKDETLLKVMKETLSDLA